MTCCAKSRRERVRSSQAWFFSQSWWPVLNQRLTSISVSDAPSGQRRGIAWDWVWPSSRGWLGFSGPGGGGWAFLPGGRGWGSGVFGGGVGLGGMGRVGWVEDGGRRTEDGGRKD